MWVAGEVSVSLTLQHIEMIRTVSLRSFADMVTEMEVFPPFFWYRKRVYKCTYKLYVHTHRYMTCDCRRVLAWSRTPNPSWSSRVCSCTRCTRAQVFLVLNGEGGPQIPSFLFTIVLFTIAEMSEELYVSQSLVTLVVLHFVLLQVGEYVDWQRWMRAYFVDVLVHSKWLSVSQDD